LNDDLHQYGFVIVAKECYAFGVLHGPNAEISAGEIGSLEGNRDLCFFAGGDYACKWHKDAIHFFSVTVDEGVPIVPGTGAGIFDLPGFCKFLARRNNGIVWVVDVDCVDIP